MRRRGVAARVQRSGTVSVAIHGRMLRRDDASATPHRGERRKREKAMKHVVTSESSDLFAVTGGTLPPTRPTGGMRRWGWVGALSVALLAIAASPATAAAGDARAVAAEATLTGTVLGVPVNLVDQILSEAAVSQGDDDQEATDTLLEIELPLPIGDFALVEAAVVSSTASSDFVRAEA